MLANRRSLDACAENGDRRLAREAATGRRTMGASGVKTDVYVVMFLTGFFPLGVSRERGDRRPAFLPPRKGRKGNVMETTSSLSELAVRSNELAARIKRVTVRCEGCAAGLDLDAGTTEVSVSPDAASVMVTNLTDQQTTFVSPDMLRADIWLDDHKLRFFIPVPRRADLPDQISRLLAALLEADWDVALRVASHLDVNREDWEAIERGLDELLLDEDEE
jgi:hypothetical protein